MKLSPTDSARRKPDQRFALHLAPTTLAIQLLDPIQLADLAADGDRCDVRDRPENLEVHERILRARRTPRSAASAAQPFHAALARCNALVGGAGANFLPSYARCGSEVCVGLQLVQHEVRHVSTGNADGPDEATDLATMAKSASLVAVG